jgi:hypothetical protein
MIIKHKNKISIYKKAPFYGTKIFLIHRNKKRESVPFNGFIKWRPIIGYSALYIFTMTFILFKYIEA